MPRVTLETAHALGQDEALRRLKDKIAELKTAYQGHFADLKEQWSQASLSFGFRAMGMKFAGTMAVGDSAVSLAADLPWAAIVFRGKIEKEVRKELATLLAPP